MISAAHMLGGMLYPARIFFNVQFFNVQFQKNFSTTSENFSIPLKISQPYSKKCQPSKIC